MKRSLSEAYSARQFAVFRIVLGTYLCLHLATLAPYAPELWSSAGMLPDSTILPTYGVFPNLLHTLHRPGQVTACLVVLAVVAGLFVVGAGRRAAAVVLWYGWACLLNRNPFVSNPGVPYVGWLLLACALIPEGEAWSVRSAWSRRRGASDPPWRMNSWLYHGAFWLLAIGYTVSGLHKAAAPSWRDGTALMHVLSLPTARDNFMCDWLLSMPGLLAVMTWSALALEISYAPLSLVPRVRPFVYAMMVAMQLGILTSLRIADLTAGMLVTHMFVFDLRWLDGVLCKGSPDGDAASRE